MPNTNEEKGEGEKTTMDTTEYVGSGNEGGKGQGFVINRGSFRGGRGGFGGRGSYYHGRPYQKPFVKPAVNSLSYYVCSKCSHKTKKGNWNCDHCKTDLFPPGYVMCGACFHAFPKTETDFRDVCWFCGINFAVKGTSEPFKKKSTSSAE